MLETPEEMADLQALLDASMASAGPHLRDIITDERRLSAVELTERLQGMRLLVLATVTADGRPLVGPVDGYFLHGTFWFSTGRHSVRLRSPGPAARLQCDTSPGRGARRHGARQGRVLRPSTTRPTPICCRPCSTSTCPKVGPEFEQGLEAMDAVGVRIVPGEDVHLPHG